MSDDFAMRARLQQVAAYRELCRGVRRSGRGNVTFALLMLFLAYLAYQNGAGGPQLIILGILVVGELLAGLFKWLVPSAEGLLLDALVILAFAAYNLGLQYLRFRKGIPLDPVIILIGLFLLMGAIERFKSYGRLRMLFAERPSSEHIAWFNELASEIRASDPDTDELALDLPTKPHWKVKLLGTTAFFVGVRDESVWIAGPEDFELLREKTDHGTKQRKAILRIHSVPYPEFSITDTTWANYQKWRAVNPFPQSLPPSTGKPG